jgi:hypothetical protein
MTATVESYQIAIVQDFIRGAILDIEKGRNGDVIRDEMVSAIQRTLNEYLKQRGAIVYAVQQGRGLRCSSQ